MALRATPTIAICLTAGIAAGIALARPGDQPDPAAAAPVAEPTSAAPVPAPEPDTDSPYIADGNPPAGDTDSPVPPDTPAPTAISIEGFDFSPSDTVAAGSPIEVTNLDGADHTLTARNGEFNSGTIGANELVSIAAPTSPGTYEFFCVIHPSVTGQLVVS